MVLKVLLTNELGKVLCAVGMLKEKSKLLLTSSVGPNSYMNSEFLDYEHFRLSLQTSACEHLD